MMRIKSIKRIVMVRILFCLGLALLVFLPAVPVAAAYAPFSNVGCAKAPDSAICQSSGTANPISGPGGVIHNLTNVIAVVAGAVAIIVIILGGISYITSNGDAEKVGKAKRAIIYAAVGLIIIVTAQAIIKLVISGV
jgi:preprotein translocase subunit SecG